MEHMSVEEPRYAMARIDPDAERGRLKKLEHINDPATLRRLDAIGVLPGWRCVEVGAGAGSIARALAARVGPTGEVVAADMDPRFLGDFAGAGRRVVTHDISEGPVPPSDFDFLHCRAVLAHVADLPNAARNLMACVRPGGQLLCEEPDYAAAEACDPNHPRAKVFSDYIASTLRGDRMDPFAGRHTHQALLDAGLEEVETDATTAIVRGGSFRALYRKHTMENARELAIRSGTYTEASLQALLDCFEDQSFSFIDALWVGIRGRVPA
jgi:2-polyprenyl-3-methyl-5-hydroxy-6-metoxy-1,4-benzoquinol methylase